ncbi:hypothetical protein BHE74_00048645 [Ensete ventricosum]|nr:hypothetical protein BHE74_00048645 [Ensete ventricosum]
MRGSASEITVGCARVIFLGQDRICWVGRGRVSLQDSLVRFFVCFGGTFCAGGLVLESFTGGDWHEQCVMGRGEEPTVKARLPQNPCAPWGPSFSFVVRSPVRRGGDHDHVGKRP